MKALRLGLVSAMVAFSSPCLLGNVNITEPIGGENISADKALNSTNGAAFTALGNIVIAEGSANDFAAGNGQTLVLTIPPNFRFNAGVGSVTFSGSRDITSASISVTASTVTITFSVGNTSKSDALTISGLQVQPLDGANAPAAGYIVQAWDNPGTASIAGIVPELTSFGLCNILAGAAKALQMHTQPATNAIAGTIFNPQPEVRVVDQFGNLRELDVTTIVTASRAAGTGTLQGSLTDVAVAGVVSYTNLSHNVPGTISIQFSGTGLTPVISDNIVIVPAPATRLAFTTQPASASVGNPFGIQPVVKTQDQFGNNTTVGLPASQWVIVSLSSGTGPLLGTATLDIGTNAGDGTVAFNNLQLDSAGNNKQLTVTSSGFTSGVSATFAVSAASFSKLQILVPGETAAPGTPSGKTGTPSPQASGNPFNVTVNAVDANWNLVNTIIDTVAITSSDSIATLPPNAALVNGTKAFSVTLNAVGSQTITASDITQPGKPPNTSSAIAVGGGMPRKLAIQTQPSSTATAGAAFAQQPVIRVEDAGGNLVTTDNGRVITAARSSGTSTLQGTLTATTINGIATFNNLSYNVAETITLNFTSSGLTNVVSGNIGVGAAGATRLAFATQPGGSSRAGSALGTQPVITAQDPFGNNSTLGLPATLLVNLALTSGSGSLSGSTTYDIGTSAGNGMVACTNLVCTAPGGNKQLTANASGLSNAVSSAFVVGGLITATGGSSISADTVGGAYTTLTGPSYYEALNGDVGTGTIILSAPAGFIFDTGGTAPTLIITRLGGSGANANNVNGVASGTAAAITSRTTNQITFTVSSASSAGVACSLTWTNVRVRPLAGTPLANGNLTKAGTSTMVAVTAGSTSFGSLNETVGLATRLAFTTQPGLAVAGAPFGNQPVVRTRDQFGNDSVVGLPASKMVSVSLSSGTGPLLGTTSLDIGTSAGNGIASFTNLEIDAALTTKQLTASASGFTNAVSSLFAVSPGAANHLSIQTIPTSGTAGAAFSPQPVIRIEDAFGNLRNLDSGTLITATRNAGSGALQGTTSVAAANGIATFANLSHTVATTLTIDFASSGLSGATSGNITINPAAASQLTIQTQPSSVATAGRPFAQQPVVRIEDQFGNLRSTDNLVVTATRDAGSGTLQGTTSLAAINGIATFANLSHNVVTNITIQFTSGSLTAATSSMIAVGPGIANRLVFATQPGSGSAGSPFAVQPVVKTQDALGNDSTAGLPGTLNVTLALTSGTGPLQGTTTLNIGTLGGNGLATFSNLQIDSTGTNKQLTASGAGLSNALSSVFSVSAGAAHHLAIQTQPSATATAGAVFAAQPVIRVEDQFGNLLTGDSSTVVVASLGSGSAALQGTLNRTALNGLVTFNNLSYNVAESIDLNFSSGSLTPATSTSIIINAGAASKLAILTQPPAAATAGLNFSLQPQVRIEDQHGNLRSSDNSTVVTVARGTGTGPLKGTLTATASSGVATFSNLNYPLAETITLVFSASSLSNATSSSVVVSAGDFAKLQVLAPGETAAPGTLSGKTGSPSTQLADVPFNMVINAVDTNWNVITSVNDMVSLSSSDPAAALPPAAALVGGTKSFSVALTSNGTNTISAVDLADSLKLGSSSGIPVIGRHTAATGGTAISADTVGGAFTALTGPTYSESASGEAGTGTIILNAPAGFVFDTGGTAPTVRIDRLSGSGINKWNINQVASGTAVAMTSINSTQMTFTVTSASGSGVACKLTWQNIRVRPVSGTPLAMNKITRSGTATMVGVLNGVSNFGLLREVPGAAARLTIQDQPSATATAGVTFTAQPVIIVKDQFGNARTAANGTADNSTVVLATRSLGYGTLQGLTSATAVDGQASFAGLYHTVANTITLAFGSGSLLGTTSAPVVITPATADRLTFTTQPANGTVGGLLVTQPVIRSRDQFGNDSTVGLSASQLVTLALSAGTGLLTGTTTLDIGSGAGNGTVTYADLMIDLAGTNKQLTASAPGLNSALSSVFTVAKANQTISFGALPGKTYGNSSFPVSATASSGLPVSFSIVAGPATINAGLVTITGAGNVTVRAAQAGNDSWNAAAPVDQSFSVSKAALTITAEDKSRAYGAVNPALTFTCTGFQYGENESVLGGTPSLNTTASPASPVSASPYPINISQGTINNLNYSYTFVPGELAITPAELSVSADNASRTYGQANPVFSGTIEGLQNGDDITATYQSSATPSSPAGSYSIVPSLVDPSGRLVNYSVASSSGVLTVTPAVLTVTADNQSRVYGAPDPAFTATITGFVDGETLANSGVTGSPGFTTSATASSTVAGGPYTITPSLGTLAAVNYSFTFANGALTITPADSTLSLNLSANPAVAGSNVTITATITAVAPSSGIPSGTVQFLEDGLPLGSPVAILSGSASLMTSSLTVGAHTIRADYAGNGNMSGSTNSIGISINNPDVSVPPCTLTGISPATNGLRITFSGQANFSYHVERTTALQATGGVWQDLGPAATDNAGNGAFTDLNPPAGQAYYRTVRP